MRRGVSGRDSERERVEEGPELLTQSLEPESWRERE